MITRIRCRRCGWVYVPDKLPQFCGYYIAIFNSPTWVWFMWQDHKVLCDR